MRFEDFQTATKNMPKIMALQTICIYTMVENDNSDNDRCLKERAERKKMNPLY